MELNTVFYLVVGFSLFSGIIGYYIGERGVQGVSNDLNNVKLDIENIKGKLNGQSSTTLVSPDFRTVSAPVTGSTVTTATQNPVATHQVLV